MTFPDWVEVTALPEDMPAPKTKPRRLLSIVSPAAETAGTAADHDLITKVADHGATTIVWSRNVCPTRLTDLARILCPTGAGTDVQ